MFKKLFSQFHHSRALSLLFGIIVAIKCLESMNMFSHGDALNYHLVGPKFWLETSWFEMTNDLYGNFQSGLFEVLYLIPVFLFGASLKAQLMGQFMHFAASLGLATFITTSWLKSKTSDRSMVFLAGMAIMTISKSGDFFLYAKNDGALAMVALTTTLLICDNLFWPKLMGLKRTVAIGIGLGLIAAIKMSGLFVVAPLSLYYVYTQRRNPKNFLLAGALALAVLFPVVFRNWYFIKSPFFPGMMNIFPGIFSPQTVGFYNHHLATSLSFHSFIDLMKAFFLGKIIFLLLPPLMYFNFKQRKKGNSIAALALAVLATYTIVNGGYVTIRFFFSCYFMIIAFIFYSLSQYEYVKKNSWVVFVLFALVMVDSKIDKSISRVVKIPKLYAGKTERQIINEVSINTTVWNYVEPRREGKTWILSDRFAQQFYSPRLVRLDQWLARPRTDFLAHCEGEAINNLKRYDYAILAIPTDNPCYNKIRSEGKELTSFTQYKLYDIRHLTW